ncbi:MAG: hypothetical protein N3A69_12600, partial [Leptospiraceae bacterium]|nr:hypothetical protein [Leptospiraceae bacterium]
ILASLIAFLIAKTFMGYLIGGILGLFAIILFIALSGLDRKSRVNFDRHRETVSFFLNEKNTLQFSYGSFKKIILKEKITQTSKSHNLQYLLFLIKSDGAEYWIDTFFTLEELQNNLELLKKYITLPIETSPSLKQFASHESKEYAHKTENIPNNPSPYLKIHSKNGYTEISFSKTKSWKSIFTHILVVLLLIAIFSIVLLKVLKVKNYLFFMFFIPFVILFFGIAFFILLVNFRRVTLLYNPEELKVQYSFPVLSFLNQEVTISKDDLQSVQVGRFDNGQFQLSISLKNPVQIETGIKSLFYTTNLLTNSSIYEEDDSTLKGKQTKLFLWVLDANVENAPNFSDLFYVERKLQEELRIIEE